MKEISTGSQVNLLVVEIEKVEALTYLEPTIELQWRMYLLYKVTIWLEVKK